MDHRSIKRPRSESTSDPTKSSVKKKQKKSKTNKGNNATDKKETAPSSLETTATAEGQTMTQVLSTFNRLEQSRFEAFRRSTFWGNAVSKFVAHCLLASHEKAFARSEKTRQYLGAQGLGVGGKHRMASQCLSHAHKKRLLSDMVAPGQAEEITVVVSTLAKAYAQRLVTAARRVATAEGHDESEPILPKHILQAHNSRARAGLDPGFFLHATHNSCGAESASVTAAALGTVNRNELKWNAALAAQEEYDKYMQEQNEKLEEANATLQGSGDEDVKVRAENTLEVKDDGVQEVSLEDALMNDLEDD